MHYRLVIKDSPNDDQSTIEYKVEQMLIRYAGYDQDYAKWLPKNLHRMKQNSYLLIEEFGKGCQDLVRYSLVAKFDYQTEFRRFKAYIGSVMRTN